jgi:hypothetical protein
MHKDLGKFNCIIACEGNDVMGFASFWLMMWKSIVIKF